MSKITKISAYITIAIIFVFIILLFLHPSFFLIDILKVSFNNPARVNAALYKYIIYLGVLGVLVTSVLRLKDSKYYSAILASFSIFFKKILSLFTIKNLFSISLIYLAILFYFAITHYDLGLDEAWYIVYAKNFVSTGIPFYTSNGKIALVDNITMLPYYLLSFINFKLDLTDIIYFKLLSSVVSVITLIILFRVTEKFWNKQAAVISLTVLIAQPGFGFIASSFFGELSQSAFLFLGLYFWLKDSPRFENKQIYSASILFALAIHTKFQLAVILTVTFIFLNFTDKDKKALKVLLYTIILTLSLIVIRSIPAFFSDHGLLRNLALVTGFFGDSSSVSGAGYVSDKLQLFNRFFPLPVYLAVLCTFYFFMRNTFERFLFLFTTITFFWWIFFYPYSTYRNPFMGFITISVIIGILICRLFEKTEYKKNQAVSYLAGIAVIIFLTYGFSANIIYAYVGYNDGVQFDLDGNRNRLFSPIVYDNSQKEFYAELNKIAVGADTLYNGSFVTSCYSDNPIADIQKMKESVQTNPARKLLLITRERYPLGLDEGRKILDSLKATYNLVLKKNENELYVIKK